MIRDRAYLNWLRDQPCLISGLRGDDRMTVDPMHVGTAGKGLKAGDNHALPIRHEYHALAHQKGEMTMFREKMPDWLLRAALRALAEQFYEEYKAAKMTGLNP